MKRIYDLYKIRRLTAAIGVFDGVHRGHQKIFKRLVRESARFKTKSAVITFHPHPREVLNPAVKIPLLASLKHRIQLIGGLGIDFCIVIKFTRSLSMMKADEFIEKVLVNKLGVGTLVVGKNFLFGADRKGSFSTLKKISRYYGFRVIGVTPVKMEGSYISSTRTREAIEKGDLKKASLMLGRPVTVLGTVIKGRRLGRLLGFPTANISPHHEAIPPSGVYAADVRIRKRPYMGILNIGTRPTFSEDREPTIELHIFNFRKNIYGKDVEITFRKKIRNEKRFLSVGALRRQVIKDISSVKRSRNI